MKNLSILLVMCLLGTLCMNAQKTTVPSFKTVQVRPGVIKVPGFNLRAEPGTRPDLKTITAPNLKAVTELAPGQMTGPMEVSTTTTKMNIELTPKNFLSIKEVRLFISWPVLIYNDFEMGANDEGRVARDQSVMISLDVTYGKQYLIRIPVTVEATVTRSFIITAYEGNNNIKLFTTTFSGSQEIAFTLAPQNTGSITIALFSSPSAGVYSFPKIIISEL